MSSEKVPRPSKRRPIDPLPTNAATEPSVTVWQIAHVIPILSPPRRSILPSLLLSLAATPIRALAWMTRKAIAGSCKRIAFAADKSVLNS